MKAKVLFGAALWAVLISVLHVSLNVGWANLARQMRVLFGGERQELIVGFLPVT
jgi:hypothetical protein